MSWRTVVISSSAKLDYQLGFLVVRKEEIVKIHISEIAMLIIESTAVSLTAALLAELMKKKVKVIFCDEKRNPSSELISYYGSHDTSIKVKKQIEWSKESKNIIWTEIVSEKIRKQAEHLERRNLKEAELLYTYIDEMRLGDETNREGHAAKVYFNALFGMDFTRTAENSINAALNYGYGVLLSACNREIVANGYITQLGLFHDNMFNPFNLIQEVAEINQNLVKFLDQVTNQVPYPIDFELELNLQALFKLYQVRVETEEGDLLNRVISYLKVMHRICNIKVYAFVGLKQYLQEEELRQLYEFVSYEKIFLVMLEAGESERLDSEKYWILDRDLCIIEPN